MTRHDILDEEDSAEAPRQPKRGISFGTLGRGKIKCAGEAGIRCNRTGTLKGGRFWYCPAHAPRGSEG